MKITFSFVFAILLFFSCTDNFNINNLDAQRFVMQLKKGTYNQYLYADDGSKLWTIMPEFSKKDIPKLIELAEDTTIVSPCGHFPTNPISSIPPFRTNIDGTGEGIMMGEYLLWCVEVIINEGKFISLTPSLRKMVNEQPIMLTGREVLMVREFYVTWWEKYGKNETYEVYPLTVTGYYWR